jgi:hypothetical protein
VLFIEAPFFTRRVHDYLDDVEYSALQWRLALQPDAGPVMRGSGGIRKLRWAVAEKGKSGGLRIIYYWYRSQNEIWMLTLYSKNEAADIAPDVLRLIRREIESWLKKGT